MCGIVGFVNFEKNISNFKNILINMNNTLSKRGPDEEGYYIDNHVALGHKRLIVIDPEGGKQPMTASSNQSVLIDKPMANMLISYSSNFIISYNGQIYNTKELRRTLEENGFSFNTHSDTEVLLKSYIYYGNNVVKHLNGIFAFAIWDSSKEELFVARDHFGVKPFFIQYKKILLFLALKLKLYLNILVLKKY